MDQVKRGQLIPHNEGTSFTLINTFFPRAYILYMHEIVSRMDTGRLELNRFIVKLNILKWKFYNFHYKLFNKI